MKIIADCVDDSERLLTLEKRSVATVSAIDSDGDYMASLEP